MSRKRAMCGRLHKDKPSPPLPKTQPTPHGRTLLLLFGRRACGPAAAAAAAAGGPLEEAADVHLAPPAYDKCATLLLSVCLYVFV
jgi:hypothetical protein